MIPGDAQARRPVIDKAAPVEDNTGSRLDAGLLRVLTIASMCWLSYEAMSPASQNFPAVVFVKIVVRRDGHWV